MTWSPATNEPPLLDEAATAIIRSCVMPGLLAGFAPAADGRRVVHLADGRTLHAMAEAEALDRRDFASRACIVYRVTGNLVVDSGANDGLRQGFQLQGEAWVDIQTKAFLHVVHRLSHVGVA
ncbi:MAG: hypothetical protein Q8O26_05245 [Phreatobacter sp.]|uniref:hypothetical protein n=1 Tax=Phreatobacter sp. TaxID=1966341 RepID=UPI00273416E9|nr:hypothetical protein [Phreatobacter sp.]MDP2801271.1 hypothetical protein [Phreatobacter sp.]